MKRLRHFGFLIIFLATLPALAAAELGEAWQPVKKAIADGLPRTAIEHLEPIIESALADEDWPEATRAVATKVALEGQIQGNQMEEVVRRLDSELAESPEPMKPMLQALLAHAYWQYFQQNRYRFFNRTQTDQPPGDDFTTWDLKRILQEIDRQFQDSLADEEYLKATPINAWDAFLEEGDYPDRYRPTLYDFLAYEALDFYTAGEQAGSQSAHDFTLESGMPALSNVDDFLEWDVSALIESALVSGDGVSPILRAMELYQELLRFHHDDTDPTAFLDTDLKRLAYAWNTAVEEDKHERFKETLRGFIDRWADYEVSAQARWYLARVIKDQDDDFVEARDVALVGKNAFPDSVGGQLCHNLIEDIESRSVQMRTEWVWNEPWPDIHIQYRNITNVWFRAVKVDWSWPYRPGNAENRAEQRLLEREPALEWTEPLVPTDDFRETAQRLTAPESLEPGFYYLFASHREDFSPDNNVISYTDIWVSDLALVVRPSGGQVSGLVLDAASGEPVAGARVEGWQHGRNRSFTRNYQDTTNQDGVFSFPVSSDNNQILVRAYKDGRQLVAKDFSYYWRHNEPGHREHSVLFTDRSIYRPGQTVQYKGIGIWSNPAEDHYTLITNRSVSVVFKDANNQEIARQVRLMNDFGSFSGSFTSPSGSLTGQMRIEVVDGPPGSTWFSVEEYKRPKFRVELAKPEQAFRLNDTIEVEGKATAFTGAAIDSAEISWRVMREPRFPPWRGWFHRTAPIFDASEEIAHGTARTSMDGTFHLSFKAVPDPAIPEEDDPRFHYRILADVTDGAGETRSDSTVVAIGYTAMNLNVSTEDWQTSDDPVEMIIETTTLDGEPVATDGLVRIHKLVEPEYVHRKSMFSPFDGLFGMPKEGFEGTLDLSDPNNWELGDAVAEESFQTGGAGLATNRIDNLEQGAYRIVTTSRDRYGKAVENRYPLMVLSPSTNRLGIAIPFLVESPKWSVEPGESFTAVWGTGYPQGRALIEIEHRNEIIRRYWSEPDQTQLVVEQPVTESLRGGFTLHVTMVRENRMYSESRRVDVPWSNKELALTWEHFRSELKPGQEESWSLVIQPAVPGPSSETLSKDAAELVATLYDASLEQFRSHQWLRRFSVFHHDHSSMRNEFQNESVGFNHALGNWLRNYLPIQNQYRHLPRELAGLILGRGGIGAQGGVAGPMPSPRSQTMEFRNFAADRLTVGEPAAAGGSFATTGASFEKSESQSVEADIDLEQVSLRKNLNETAFFFPQLTSDTNGVVRMTFTMPEALTEWRFMGFAHDRQLRSGYLEATAVTSKDIMVQPNPPRFVREGDVLKFTVKVSNQSAARQTGQVRLTFADARTEASVDEALGNVDLEKVFDIPSKESRTFAWRIQIPDNTGLLTFKAVGSTGRLSDGEEGYLPVLSRKVFLTESLPLHINGPGDKEFSFEAMKKAGGSDTLQQQSLTVQMVSNPAWYAVLALPYLMEFPHECTEQIFNRFYANSLAAHIARSDPKIRNVFNQWKNTDALESPLENNEELKSVLLEETPWVRQAASETEARRNIGILFDANRLSYEQQATLDKLRNAQLEDGRWSWFPGGQANDYITLYIATGFGRLRHLGADIDVQPALRALNSLDQWMSGRYREITRNDDGDEYVPSPTICLYLYGRSFFLNDQPVDPAHRPALDFFLKQGRKHWLETGNRQSQGHLAISFQRFGDAETARAIGASLKERSVTDEELGRFWRDTERSWWWYRAPIETQALMIELFDEVMADADAVEECRTWLLKQKQTRDWKTTKATADAVYALLLRGMDLLGSDALVEVELGETVIAPGRDGTADSSGRRVVNPLKGGVEAGTGFYEVRFQPAAIKAGMSDITVSKSDRGPAWGGVHWQYFEDLSKVEPHEGTPLKLVKRLYKKTNTSDGPELREVDGPLSMGDELVVRVELRVDRDMEYVHLKDQRASGTEPVNVLSGYRYQDGLRYYESIRDTASHFYIDYLPKGAYVFEYSTRVQLRGEYETGIAEIQCMYAPEFNSHSQSRPVIVGQ